MDKQVKQLIDAERHRQQHELELIASENYVSPAVMQAYSNVFTNKYSEGYPSKRYYGGQIWVDAIERLCQWRALHIFSLQKGKDGAQKEDNEPDVMHEDGQQQIKEDLQQADWAVNVQPLSGSPANLAVYLGTLEPGETILGMDLAAGGHLSHGHPLNASGVYYNIEAYGVDKQSHRLDYEQLRAQALKHKPALILAGFSAYPRTIDWGKFADVADAVEAEHGYRPLLMADIAHIAGLIAGGVLQGPFEVFDIVTTTTHKTLRGPRGGLIYTRKGKCTRNDKEYNLEKAINRGVFPGVQGGPHEHIVAAKAVAFGEILYGVDEAMRGSSDFSTYTQHVVDNAKTLANALQDKGWPLVTGGTDNHLLTVNVTQCGGTSTGLTGRQAERTLEAVGISCNKNMIPFDERSPLDPSGIRLGTPAITTRGLGMQEMEQLATIIDTALRQHNDQDVLETLRTKVRKLCKKFPLPYQ